MSRAVKPVRSYDNRARTERSLERQRRVVEVVARLVVAEGYAGTSMAAVASAAEVSVPWLYKTFGPKPALVKRTYDALLAGDLEAVPLAQREAYQAISDSRDLADQLRRYAAIARGITERVGDFNAALVAAARAGEPDLQEFARATAQERLTGATILVRALHAAGTLPTDADLDRARDVVALHISPDAHRLLVLERGWDLADFEAWFATSLHAALSGPPVRHAAPP